MTLPLGDDHPTRLHSTTERHHRDRNFPLLIDPTRFSICWQAGKQVFHLFNKFLPLEGFAAVFESLSSSGFFRRSHFGLTR